MGRARTAALCAALATVGWLAAAAAPALAGGTLDEDLAHCRELIEEEEWEKGEAAVRALLVTHESEPLVFGHVEEIEESLRLCMFRQERGAPTGEELFGRYVKHYDAHSRKLTLEFRAPEGPLWESAGELRVLDVRFDGSFDLEFSCSVDTGLMAVVCYDIEQQGGYVVIPALSSVEYLRRWAQILKLQNGERESLDARRPKGLLNASGPFKISRKSAVISLRQGFDQGRGTGMTTVATARDKEFTSGYIALGGEPRQITMSGRLDKYHSRSRVGEYLAAAYVKWKDAWRREEHLPAWLLAGPEAVELAPVAEWPSDFPDTGRPALDGTLRHFKEGRIAEFVLARRTLGKLPERTALYLDALEAFALGRYARAARMLGRLIEAEPDFAVAYVLRGRARFEARDTEGALADFDAAGSAAEAIPEAYAGRATVQIFAGDLDAARNTLAEAAARGIEDAELDELRSWVHRAHRGPAWTKRFEHETEHFVVRSDHGKKMCFEVAQALERERKHYAKAIGEVPKGAPKSRVYVFSGRDGYLDYAGDLALDLSWTSGVYIPVLRELAIWVPIDKSDLAHTVRHEGFHQYLHHFIEDAPLWLNEGYAETFGRTRGEHRRADPARWAAYQGRLVPVRDLMQMGRHEFLANAALHYPQSDDVVRFLIETEDPRFEGLLHTYVESLRLGLSGDEAYEEVFEDQEDALQEAFLAYMAGGG